MQSYSPVSQQTSASQRQQHSYWEYKRGASQMGLAPRATKLQQTLSYGSYSILKRITKILYLRRYSSIKLTTVFMI